MYELLLTAYRSHTLKFQSIFKWKSRVVGSNFGIASALSNYPSDTWGKEDIEVANEKAAQRVWDFIFNE